MLTTALDHIVVTASSRALGSTVMADLLGVAPQPGGDHARMGTHNALLRLGPACYLEVIAVNPRAATPTRARWFGLDQLDPAASPRLAGWVARTTDIGAATALSPWPLGPIETMARDTWRWQITIPPDGNLLLDGAAPSLIEWSSSVHPADALPDVGCSLEALEIRHAQHDLLTAWLHEIGFAGPVMLAAPAAGQPVLVAHLRTPRGVCTLGAL